MALITTAQAKTHLGVTGSDDDDVIGDMIGAATEAMEQACRRHLDPATVTEYLDGTGSRLLWLNEPPDGGHDGITSIHSDSARAWAAASLVDSDDYYVDGCQVEYLDHAWVRGNRNVRVIYEAGYATVPDDLGQACKAQVAKLYSEWGAAKAALNILEDHSVEGWKQTFRAHGGLDPECADIVTRYIAARL